MNTNIKNEPIFECYRLLIDYLFKNSESFFLHIPDGLRVDESAYSILNEMNEHLIKIIPSNNFSHADYSEGKLYVFRCNNKTNQIVKNRVSGLYDWLLPELPEDLSFIRKNSHVWFKTISHEDMGWFIEISNSEIYDLSNIIEI